MIGAVPTASVRVLGPVEIDVDGASVAVGGERQRALVAALALRANRSVGVGDLVAALWGDDAGEHDHEHRLQQLVSSLRKLLEPNRPREVEPTVLVTAPPGYALRCESVDVDRFEAAAADAAQSASASRWPDALERLDDALRQWHGVALADVRVSAWFDAVAVRLDDRRLVVHEARVDTLLALGRAADAIGDLERLVVEAPYRERFRSQLMLAYYRCDRQADALAVFRRTRALLVDELGVEPGPELRQLETAILRHDPDLRDDRARVLDRDAGMADELAETFRADHIDRGYVVRPDGQIITLRDGSSVIGRDPAAEVQLVDSRVSRRHARIDRVDDSYLVHDLGSTNGTTVNGVPAEGQMLRDGDRIGIGSIVLHFHERQDGPA
jgi:DNA-binding SARP family transcriptional activator